SYIHDIEDVRRRRRLGHLGAVSRIAHGVDLRRPDAERDLPPSVVDAMVPDGSLDLAVIGERLPDRSVDGAARIVFPGLDAHGAALQILESIENQSPRRVVLEP